MHAKQPFGINLIWRTVFSNFFSVSKRQMTSWHGIAKFCFLLVGSGWMNHPRAFEWVHLIRLNWQSARRWFTHSFTHDRISCSPPGCKYTCTLIRVGSYLTYRTKQSSEQDKNNSSRSVCLKKEMSVNFMLHLKSRWIALENLRSVNFNLSYSSYIYWSECHTSLDVLHGTGTDIEANEDSTYPYF